MRTEPESFAVVEDLDTEIRFYFDERISEQIPGGTFADAVSVSPRSGEVRVDHGSRTLSVRVEGGLRPDVVYRVTVLPLISDLFGNQLRDPFELVFSTGAEPVPTALAGEVWDRISGRGVSGARVQAVGPDSLVYLATADEEGIFAFRYLPPGTFTLTAFEDANRDGEAGPREVKGSRPATLSVGDTLLVDLAVLPPDTTEAVLARASTLDSVTVVLEFDDYLDPDADASTVAVDLSREEGIAPGVTRLFLEHEYAAYVTRVTDSLRAIAPPPPAAPPVDTTAVGAVTPDTAVAPLDTAGTGAPARDTTAAGRPGVTLPTDRGGRGGRGAAPAPVPGAPPALAGARGAGAGGGRGQAAATPPDRVLPGRRLVALVDAPLEPEVEYQVSVTGVVNLNSLGGGGGEATLVLPATPEPEDAAEPDSTGVPPEPSDADSTRAPGAAPAPDTLGARGGGR